MKFLFESLVFRFFQLPFFRKKGISVVVSCQDDHLTLRDCVESFLIFGDEIIIVSNNATKETVALCNELADEYQEKVSYFDAENANDLYQNRQFGLERSKYSWVFRCDADYVACDELDHANYIGNLRAKVLATSAFRPTAFYLTKIGLSMGWKSMYKPESKEVSLKYIPEVFNSVKEPRIYSVSPLLYFTRLGRWEGAPHIRLYKKIHIEEVYWFEVTIRSSESLLLRKARTDWRELGDFVNYPKLIDYVEKVYLPENYPSLSLEGAASQYIQDEVLPYISDYDEVSFIPLTSRIRNKSDKSVL